MCVAHCTPRPDQSRQYSALSPGWVDAKSQFPMWKKSLPPFIRRLKVKNSRSRSGLVCANKREDKQEGTNLFVPNKKRSLMCSDHQKGTKNHGYLRTN